MFKFGLGKNGGWHRSKHLVVGLDETAFWRR